MFRVKNFRGQKHRFSAVTTYLTLVILSFTFTPTTAEGSVVLKGIELEGGWVSAVDERRKCVDTTPGHVLVDYATSDPPPPDIGLSWKGNRLIQAGWEFVTEYTVKTVKSDIESELVVELDFEGAGEGETWIGSATWFLSLDTEEVDEEQRPVVTSFIKVERQSDASASKATLDKEIPYAVAYVKCLK